MGNKWSEIAAFFEGRNDNFIKNCFYSAIRRNLRKYNKKKVPSKQLKGTISSLLKNNQARKILMDFPEHRNPELYKEEHKNHTEIKEEHKNHTEIKEEKSISEAKHKLNKKALQIKVDYDNRKERIVEQAADKNQSKEIEKKIWKKPLQIATPLIAPIAQKGIDDITPTLNAQMIFGLLPDEMEPIPELSSKNYSLELFRFDSTKSDSTLVPNYKLPDFSPKNSFQHYISPRHSK